MMIIREKILINKYHLFLASLLYLSPFVDASTGVLVGNKIISEAFIGSPSQIFRTLLFFYAFAILRTEHSYYKIILISIGIISLEILSYLAHGSLAGLLTGIGFSYKLVYAFILFYLFDVMLKTGRIEYENLLPIFRNSGFLYCGVILASTLLGINYPTYAQGTFGTKGLYASGNGLGVFVGVTTIIGNYYYFITRKMKDLLIFVFMFFSLIIIGTKASFIFSIINILSFFWFSNKIIKVILFIPASILLFSFKSQIFALLQTILEVAIFRFNNRDSIITFIFSGRDNYVLNAFNEYSTSGFLKLRILFGGGAFLSFRDPSLANLVYDTLETDAFDIFFMYGVIGLIFYIAIFITGFYFCIKSFNAVFFFCWSAIFLHSVTAGHIMFNGNSVLAVIVLLVLIKYNYIASFKKPVLEK